MADPKQAKVWDSGTIQARGRGRQGFLGVVRAQNNIPQASLLRCSPPGCDVSCASLGELMPLRKFLRHRAAVVGRLNDRKMTFVIGQYSSGVSTVAIIHIKKRAAFWPPPPSGPGMLSYRITTTIDKLPDLRTLGPC
jgi:hypothetical protein